MTDEAGKRFREHTALVCSHTEDQIGFIAKNHETFIMCWPNFFLYTPKMAIGGYKRDCL